MLFPLEQKARCQYCGMHSIVNWTQRKCPDCPNTPALCQTTGRDCHAKWHSPSLDEVRDKLFEKKASTEAEMGIDVYGTEYYISQHDGSFHPLQKRELVENLGVYVSYLDLESKQLSSKGSATGLMRQLISVYYKPQRLAACSASSINSKIRTAVFSKCIHVACSHITECVVP